MSDQSPYPQKTRKHSAGPRSAESKFVGYLVLSFGVLAVVAVLLLAFMQRGPKLDVAQPDPQRAQEIIQTAPENLIQAPEPVKPKLEETPHFKRQADFRAENMRGNWQAMIGRYTAVLQMNEGVYQVILANDNMDAPRLYSSGEYTILEDIITLTPRNDWPKPATNNQNIGYQRITRAPFSVVSAFYEGKMLWQNVPPGERRVLRTIKSPLFMSEDVDYVVWQKIK